MFEQQPMKMASAEALCHTESRRRLLDLRRRRPERLRERHSHQGAGAAARSWRTARFDSRPSRASTTLQAAATRRRSGPATTCRTCRSPTGASGSMIGWAGAVGAARRGRAVADPRAAGCPDKGGSRGCRSPASRRRSSANSAGWIFTEMGRQPWVVAPNPTGVDRSDWLSTQGVSNRSPGDGADLADRVHAGLRRAGGGRGSLIRRYAIEAAARARRACRPGDDHDEPEEPGEPEQLSFALLGETAMGLQSLVHPHRGALGIGLLRPRGFRFRRRHADAGAGPAQGPNGDNAAGGDQHDRPGVGRQRGVAHHRGRRDCSRRSRSGTPRCSPASICRCCSSSSR